MKPASQLTKRKSPKQVTKTLKQRLERLTCPITQSLFRNPVIASDGHTYDRSAITEWHAQNPTSPITRERISNVFFRARYIENEVADFIKEFPEYKIEIKQEYKPTDLVEVKLDEPTQPLINTQLSDSTKKILTPLLYVHRFSDLLRLKNFKLFETLKVDCIETCLMDYLIRNMRPHSVRVLTHVLKNNFYENGENHSLIMYRLCGQWCPKEVLRYYIKNHLTEYNVFVNGQLPIHYAADRDFPSLVCEMIENGSEANPLTMSGYDNVLSLLSSNVIQTREVKIAIDYVKSIVGEMPR